MIKIARLLVAAGVLLAAGCGIPACFPPIPGLEIEKVLRDLAAGTGPSALKDSTTSPSRKPIDYTVEGRAYQGDLYRGNGDPQAGIVLIPGASPHGRDDPRMVAFASTFARVRFAVLVPEIATLREEKVRPEDVQVMGDALSYIADRPDLSPKGRAGIGAFSYALGPAILAAISPAVRDKVRFVLGVGGYFDMTSVATFATTGYYREDGLANGKWLHLEPNAFGKWVFVKSNSERLADTADKETLSQMVTRKLKDSAADISDLEAKLGPEGRTVNDLLLNRDPDKVPALLAKLPEAIRKDMATLDLNGKDLSGLKARLHLAHSKGDDVVPYTESIALSRAAPAGKTDLHLLTGLTHVDIGNLSLVDAWRMACPIDRLLSERGRDD